MNGDLYAESIDRIVTAAMTAQTIPGLAILVAQERRIIFARGYGLRNVGENLPVDEGTSFSIASISKQFTAAAIMQLHERGLLALDDRIDRYLPWFRYAPNVTIAHLMTHTSGIAGYTELDDFDLRCTNPAAPREVVETILEREPAFAPGDEWQYSNTNYVILGAILEAVAQKSYRDVIESDLLAGLDATATVLNDATSIRSNAALGFTAYWLGPLEPARDWHPSWGFGTAGLRSNVLDLFTWNVALRSGRVVTEPSLQAMRTAAMLNDGQRVSYGLGLQLGQTPIGRVTRHTGGLPGFTLENTTFLDREIDIIVLTNGDATPTEHSITRPIAALLTTEPRLRSPAPDAEERFGAEIAQPNDALDVVNAFLCGALDAGRITDRFKRVLTPAHLDAVRAFSRRGPVRALHPLQSFRRDPVNLYTYRADFDDAVLRADLWLRDDGRVDGVWFSPRGRPDG
jgi:D-alanyl-D-alanine carboxypeptidase